MAGVPIGIIGSAFGDALADDEEDEEEDEEEDDGVELKSLNDQSGVADYGAIKQDSAQMSVDSRREALSQVCVSLLSTLICAESCLIAP